MENPPPAPVRSPSEPIKVEPVKTPERELYNSHFRAVHGRILLGGETLNPDHKNIPLVTKESLSNGSPQILNECATNCRRKEATVEKDRLEEEIATRVSKNTSVLKQDLSKIKSFDQEKAARWQSTLTKLFGKDTASASESEVRALFDKYFYSKDKLGNDSNTDLFAEDVLKAFDGDVSRIEENTDCVIWYARICGFTQDYSETVFKHQVTAKALLNSKPDQLVEELNQKQSEDQSSRINNTNNDEDQVLRFIWGNKGEVSVSSSSVEPPSIEIKSTESNEKQDEVTEQKPFESGKDYTLEQLFENVQGEVNSSHHFFVENPPSQISLTNEEINRLGLIEPFITNVTMDGNRLAWQINQNVAPFVFELGEGGTDPNQRFINGEKATDGDSGLVGLAAASGENPEDQALLYHDLAGAIISVHERNPDLLRQWLDRQRQTEKDDEISSLAILSRDDLANDQKLKSEHERLFIFSEEKLKNSPDRALEDFLPTWQRRIVELKQAMSENKLQKHHLRWMELLAHSVDVGGLVDIIKEKAGPQQVKITKEPVQESASDVPAEASSTVKEPVKSESGDEPKDSEEEKKKKPNIFTRIGAKFSKKKK